VDLYFFTWFPLALIKIEKDAAAAFEYYARILLPPFWFMLGFLLKGVQAGLCRRQVNWSEPEAGKQTPTKVMLIKFFFSKFGFSATIIKYVGRQLPQVYVAGMGQLYS